MPMNRVQTSTVLRWVGSSAGQWFSGLSPTIPSMLPRPCFRASAVHCGLPSNMAVVLLSSSLELAEDQAGRT